MLPPSGPTISIYGMDHVQTIKHLAQTPTHLHTQSRLKKRAYALAEDVKRVLLSRKVLPGTNDVV